jgi:hypothetical protein
MTFLLGGCADPGKDICGGEGDSLCLGTFGEFLRKGNFEGSLEVDEPDSYLALTLFREDGQLAAEVVFDGDIVIWGWVDVIDFGKDEYEVDDLKLRHGTAVKGEFDIPNFPLNAHFKGTFMDEFETLVLVLTKIGDISLRIDQQLGVISLMRIDDLEERIEDY